MRKKGFILIVIAVIFTSNIVFAGTSKFNDLSDEHWAFKEITEMTNKGIIAGYPDGTFKPDNLLTYGEFIKMASIIGGIISEDEIIFRSDHWARPYYDAGLNMGYFTKYDIDKAALDRCIPRGYMALIASSMLGDIDLTDYSNILEDIVDIDSRTPYEHHIIRAYSSGVLAGYPDSTFRPEQPLTRAEAISVISRLSSLMDIKEPVTDEEPFVTTGRVVSSDPEGTITLTIRDYGSDINAQNAELKNILDLSLPEEADELYEAFCDFASKETGPGNQGIRKQYFGDYPVLMERISTTVRIFVYPVGYTNRTWKTEPGEINEFFF